MFGIVCYMQTTICLHILSDTWVLLCLTFIKEMKSLLMDWTCSLQEDAAAWGTLLATKDAVLCGG